MAWSQLARLCSRSSVGVSFLSLQEAPGLSGPPDSPSRLPLTWALSTVLIRPPRPCSPSGRRVPRVSLPASVKGGSERSATRRGPQAWLPGLPGLPGFPLPRPRSACFPSPRPAHPAPPVYRGFSPALVWGGEALHQDEIFHRETATGPKSLLLREPKHHRAPRPCFPSVCLLLQTNSEVKSPQVVGLGVGGIRVRTGGGTLLVPTIAASWPGVWVGEDRGRYLPGIWERRAPSCTRLAGMGQGQQRALLRMK